MPCSPSQGVPRAQFLGSGESGRVRQNFGIVPAHAIHKPNVLVDGEAQRAKPLHHALPLVLVAKIEDVNWRNIHALIMRIVKPALQYSVDLFELLWYNRRLIEEMTLKKTISCGVVITDGQRVVLGHITQGKYWDIPKGGMDPGETFEQAAIRELKEETGLAVQPSQLTSLGRFDYKPKKDLELFLWQVSVMPNPGSLHCASTWQDKRGRDWPELDRFAVVIWDQALNQVTPDLARVLKQIKESLS